MFDPTAYENMKVVIEGAFYDWDLHGEISIIDRNDIVNLAKLSRTYEITFILPANEQNRCTFRLHGKLANFAAELLQTSDDLQGAYITIVYEIHHAKENRTARQLKKELELIWGKQRKMNEKITTTYENNKETYISEITVDLNRIIKEEQIDEIVEMIDYTIESLQKINSISI